MKNDNSLNSDKIKIIKGLNQLLNRGINHASEKYDPADYRKMYRITHKRQESERAKRYRKKYKLMALNAYGGPICACCGETLLEGLAIDHINGDGASHRKTYNRGGGSFYFWLKQNNYPPGFQVLCGTCNQAKGTKDHCPHQDIPGWIMGKGLPK